MNGIRQILAISGKELRMFWTDKGAFGVYFLLPALLSLFMVGLPAQAAWEEDSGGAESALQFNVLVVNLDEGGSGAEVLRVLSGIEVLAARNLSSAEEAAQMVADGEGDAAVVIPADFSQKIQSYEPTTVQVVIDPTQPETAGIVTGIVNNVVDEFALWGEINYGVRAVLTEAGALDMADPAVVQEVEAQTTGIIMTQLNKARQDPFIAVSSENLSGVETLTELEQILASVQPTFAVMFAFFIAGPISMSIFSREGERIAPAVDCRPHQSPDDHHGQDAGLHADRVPASLVDLHTGKFLWRAPGQLPLGPAAGNTGFGVGGYGPGRASGGGSAH